MKQPCNARAGATKVASRLAIGIIAWSMMHAAAALAATDAELQPLGRDSPLAGRLGAVGMMIVGEMERVRALGTGFLITPCHVVTAAHVLARGDFQARVNMQVRFVPSSGERAFALTRDQVYGRVVALDESFHPGSPGSMADPANVARDWALIELEQAVAGVEPFKMLYPGATLASDAQLHSVGYASSPSMTYLYAHENCRLRDTSHGQAFAGRMLIADCAVRPGMSGGPLLFEDAGGQLLTAGIVVERIQTGDRVLAVAVPVQAFAQRIAAAMRSSNVCAAGQPYAIPRAKTD
jgi:V8-like Glu-specific endopeptidase